MAPADDVVHLRRATEVERVDYLTVVASVVSADREASADELATLEELCRDAGLSDAQREAVVATAHGPDAAVVDAAIARLRRNVALRVDLVTDAIAIVFADGKVAPTESAVIARLGRALGVPQAQLGMLGRYVESVVLQRGDGGGLSRELGDGVAAARGPGVIRRVYDRFRRG